MKKIFVFSLVLGLVSPLIMFAETDSNSDKVITTPPVIIAYNATCASNAVITHENIQETIVENRQTSMKIAITTRRDALGSAYLLTDKITRDIAIKTAHDAFMTAQKIADKAAMDASKIENKSFKTIMEGCGAKLPPQTRDQIDNQNGHENNGNQLGLNQEQKGNSQNAPGKNKQEIKKQETLNPKTDQLNAPILPKNEQNRPWWKIW